MSSLTGYFLLHRQAIEGWLWDLPPPQFKVMVTILAMANWKQGKTFSGGKIVTIERGQFMTSLPGLAKKSKCSLRTVRTTLSNLEKAGFLTDTSTRRYRIVTVINYETYQNPAGASDSPSDSRATVQRQSSDSPATVIEASKHINTEAEKQTSVSAPRRQPPPAPAEAVELATLLAELIDERIADYRELGPTRRVTTLARWANDFRLAHQRDGRPWAEMSAVLEWSQADDFWQGNILSGSKFRKQYESLRAQMARGAPRAAGSLPGGEKPLTAEWLLEHARKLREQGR
jgi:hypothetical protein